MKSGIRIVLCVIAIIITFPFVIIGFLTNACYRSFNVGMELFGRE